MYQLCRALSAIPVDHKKLSDILHRVADFRQPKVQERGYFQLKPEWWTKFDPLFAQFYPNELEDVQVGRFIIVPTSCRFHDKILDAGIDNIS
jgi:hypothetical protein